MSNKQRGQTLGDFLVSLDSSQPRPVNEAEAASIAFNPGFPAEKDLGTPAVDPAHNEREPLLKAGQLGAQDLKYDHLKAFSLYARDLTSKYNSTHPNSETFAGGSNLGGARGSVIKTDDSPTSFLTKFAEFANPTDGTDKAISYLENISGGGSPTGDAGGFFDAAQMRSLKLEDVKSAPAGPLRLGNWLLTEGLSTSLIKTTVDNVLDESNMYSPNPAASPYTGYTPGGAAFSNGMEGFFRKGGLYSIQTGAGNLGKFDKDAPRLTVKALRGLVLKQMLAASGESTYAKLIPTTGPNDFEQALKQFAGMLAAANAASLDPTNGVQIGINAIDLADVTLKSQIPEAFRAGGAARPAMERLFNSIGAGNFTDGISDSPFTSNNNRDSNVSIGNLTSWAEHFDGPLPLGMLNTVLIGLISFVLIGALIDTIIKKPKADSYMVPDTVDPESPWSMKMGEARPKGGGNDLLYMFMKLFGLPEIQSDTNFAAAFFRGAQRFYGFDFDFRDLFGGGAVPMPALARFAELMESAINIALAPGFYAVMQRVIMRDINKIASAFDLGPTTAGGAMAAVQIFKAVEALATSTTFRFVIVCIGLGDKAYDAKWSPGRVHTGNTNGTITYDLEPAVKVLKPGNRMMLSRFHGSYEGDRVRSPLSLATFGSLIKASTHSSLDLSDAGVSIDVISGDTETNESMHANQKAANVGFSSIAEVVMAENGKRFGRDIVEAYENYLENEYTPFYVQDLRTNEIIAMPAFITSVAESFAPEYNESHGYGRTDPVFGYVKTRRNIDLTFKIAAMNPEDHQYMWFVINKLVTMCYPQRSVGRVRHFGGGTGRFVQPFSQVPTASPMIRLRLGELLHSNFSNNRLGRLFGAGTPLLDLEAPNKTDTKYWDDMKERYVSKQSLISVVNAIFLKQFRAEKSAQGGAKYLAGPGTSFIVARTSKYSSHGGTSISGGSGPLAPASLGGGGNDKAYTSMPIPSHLPPVPFKIVSAKPFYSEPEATQKKATPFRPKNYHGRRAFYEVEFDMTFDGTVTTDKNVERAQIAMLGIKKVRKNSEAQRKSKTIRAYMPIDAVKGLKLAKNQHQTKTWKDELAKRMKEVNADAEKLIKKQQNSMKTIEEQGFFGDKNAIVRSFGATKGRGLAGFITQMALNYDEAEWGSEFKKHNRAPKFVEVAMSFAPVHDLPLGLDSSGEIIAPSHPVGPLYQDPWSKYTPQGAPEDPPVTSADADKPDVEPEGDKGEQ